MRGIGLYFASSSGWFYLKAGNTFAAAEPPILSRGKHDTKLLTAVSSDPTIKMTMDHFDTGWRCFIQDSVFVLGRYNRDAKSGPSSPMDNEQFVMQLAQSQVLSS